MFVYFCLHAYVSCLITYLLSVVCVFTRLPFVLCLTVCVRTCSKSFEYFDVEQQKVSAIIFITSRVAYNSPLQKKIRNQISSKNVSGREVGKLKKGSDIYDFRIGNVRARQSSKIRRKMHGGAQVAGPKNHARKITQGKIAGGKNKEK